jgi:hypothetical protein
LVLTSFVDSKCKGKYKLLIKGLSKLRLIVTWVLSILMLKVLKDFYNLVGISLTNLTPLDNAII